MSNADRKRLNRPPERARPRPDHARDKRPGYFATVARGIEDLLAAELGEIGATNVAAGRGGVGFDGSLEIAYRVCLWSRLASRILLPLASFRCRTEGDLYDGVRDIDWLDHLDAGRTLAVEFTGGNERITHTHFGALKTKDAIVDLVRDRTGNRPSVSARQPDVQVYVHLHDDRANVGIDLSGESLHRRGYRRTGGLAPLKETLAAAILRRMDWPRLALDHTPLLDPMCGSGTLPIEAGLIATDVAPGLLRDYFGVNGWKQHNAALWKRLRAEATDRRSAGSKRAPPIYGYDHDGRAVREAIDNVERAGLRGVVHIEKRDFAECQPLPSQRNAEPFGLFVVNPPYGERLGEEAELRSLYPQIGDVLRRRFPGWTGFVFTGNPDLARIIGLRPKHRHVLFNGAIECRLLEFPISSVAVEGSAGPGWRRERG